MRNLVRLLLAAFVFASALAWAGDDVDLRLGQLGISYREYPASHGFTFAFLTAGYDYSGNKSEAERIIPARLFLASNDANPAHLHSYLTKYFGSSIPEISRVEHDPLLASRPSLAGKYVFEITPLFSESLTRNLGRPGEVVRGESQCSNCMGLAASFETGDPVDYVETNAFKSYLSRSHAQPIEGNKDPKYRDIIFMGRREHAAIFLFDHFVFQKPTWGVFHNYEIVRYDEMFDTMNNTIKMFSRGAPAGSITRSAWDIFLSTIEGTQPIGNPPALSDTAEVQLYRLPSCLGLLTEANPAQHE